jgi:hypothetical protein
MHLVYLFRYVPLITIEKLGSEVLQVRFQVLTAASMKFKIVFWDVLLYYTTVHPRTRYSKFDKFFFAVFPNYEINEIHQAMRSDQFP